MLRVLSVLVTYQRPQDLVRDYDEQLRRGGLLVRAAAPPGLELYGEVELRIAAPDAEVTLRSQLVQVFPGVGMAVKTPFVDVTEAELALPRKSVNV